MSYYSNPTANRAMGAVDKLIRKKTHRAERLGELSRTGKLHPKIRAQLPREFSGIYRPLLRVALGELTLKELFPENNA
jgi:hypothetical protein